MKLTATQPRMARTAARQPAALPVDLSTIIPGFADQNATEARRDTLIAPSHAPLRATRRLVVLVPEGELDELALARRVWQMASPARLQVLFLGRSAGADDAAFVRRRLALLAASVHQGEVQARATVVAGRTWRQAVQPALRRGDVLVCLSEHRVLQNGLWRKRLGNSLAATFDAPIYMLGDLAVGHSPAFVQRVRALAAWSLSIAILAAFGGLQIWLSGNADLRLSPILICLSIIAEGITLFKTNQWLA